MFKMWHPASRKAVLALRKVVVTASATQTNQIGTFVWVEKHVL
jgi:hypothetical protein